MLLDLTPRGRSEQSRGDLADWVRHHDRYDGGGQVDRGGRYVAPDAGGACCRAAEPRTGSICHGVIGA
jgi:hypothetical protein